MQTIACFLRAVWQDAGEIRFPSATRVVPMNEPLVQMLLEAVPPVARQQARQAVRHMEKAIECTPTQLHAADTLALLLAAAVPYAPDAEPVLAKLDPAVHRRVSQMRAVTDVTHAAATPVFVRWPYYIHRFLASGWSGLDRLYNVRHRMWLRHQQCFPLYTLDTLRARTRHDLLGRVANRGSTAATTLMDYCYSQLLDVSHIDSGNVHIQSETLRRYETIVDVCLQFGRDGFIEAPFWQTLRMYAMAEWLPDTGGNG